MHVDVAVVGAGIVGLATTRALLKQHPGLRVAVIDKEPLVGRHQTGNNSGVIHAGIYYRPGSLKARLCVRGAAMMKAFCTEAGLPIQHCGKLIVAVTEEERPRLEALFERGQANGVPGLRWLEGDEMRAVEPEARGVAAIHSPASSIVNYRMVAKALARQLQQNGVVFRLGSPVRRLERRNGRWRVYAGDDVLAAERLINCAGLHSDRIARMAGLTPDVQIVPFRGEYYMLRPERRWLVRGLIYPTPDPDLPFLGVHLTRMINGGVEAGPNAVLAWAREGYSHDVVNIDDLVEMIAYPGFRRLARRYWRVGVAELRRSLSKSLFTRSVQRLLPALREEDLVPGGAGVRAQAVNRSGELVDDFVLQHDERALHVLNAPSPAATASLAIGEHIVQQLR